MSDKSTSLVSPDQRKAMLDFMEQHVDFATGRLRSLEARHTSKKLWKELASILNSSPDGIKKTADGWSKYWSDYKIKVKNKVTMLRKMQKVDGVSSKRQMGLSKLEMKALHIIGPYFEKRAWKKKDMGFSHNPVTNQLPAVVKLEASQESPVVSYIPRDWPNTDNGDNDKNSEAEDNSKESDGCDDDFVDSEGSVEEPMIHGVYPKWLMTIEKKRAEAEYIRAKAEESHASASIKRAEAAVMQAEALQKLASAAHTQAEAIMKIAIALEDRRKRDDILGM